MESLQGLFRNDCFTIMVGSLLVGSGVPLFVWIRRSRRIEQELVKLRPGRLVVITGCDSGLGMAMAQWAASTGYKVLAGCYSLRSEGSKSLRNEFSEQDLHLTELDVTKKDSLENFRITCQNIIQSSEGYTKLWALIPNAGVGCFGEFFWMTDSISRRMMEVNFWGTVNLTNIFHPLLLQFKSRLIVVTSDCADFPLPGLSIYSASKAALQNWALALRLEVAKFGITVTSFQPGNFPRQSRLFSSQREAYEEMKISMCLEDSKFYGEYFSSYNNRLIGFLELTLPTKLREDKGIQKVFLSLLEKNLALVPIVIQNPISLKFIHFLSKVLPIKASDRLKLNLLKTPTWHQKEYPISLNEC